MSDRTAAVRIAPRWRRTIHRAVQRTNRRDLTLLGMMLVVLACGAVAVSRSGLRIQHTGSLPMGLYRDVGSASPVRGAIGVWCLPLGVAQWARARGYIGGGSCPGNVEPLGKVVLAAVGDTVTLSADGITVNGVAIPNSRPAARDSRGRLLTPASFGTYILRRGEVWIGSPYTDRSFDSRYFGPVPDTMLLSVVRPVWTLPSHGSAQDSVQSALR